VNLVIQNPVIAHLGPEMALGIQEEAQPDDNEQGNLQNEQVQNLQMHENAMEEQALQVANLVLEEQPLQQEINPA
jgi:hypothetical protein